MVILGIILFIVFLPDIISGLMAIGALGIGLIGGIFAAMGKIFS